MVSTQNSNLTNQNNWLLRWKQDAQPKLRLFCFPFAGGGAFHYRPWSEQLAPNIEVCAIQLPGRENRLGEKPPASMKALLPILTQTIEPFMDVPFAFFGYSMGGLLAFQLCLELRRLGKPLPKHLYIASAGAPHMPRNLPLLHKMSDRELIDQMMRYGGTANEILNDKDMMAIFIPLLRADCALFETHIYDPSAPLDLPITVFGSSDDHRIAVAEMNGWSHLTTGTFKMYAFPGGHFFMKDKLERDKVLKTVADTSLNQLG